MAIFTPPTDNFVVPVIVGDYMGGLRLSKDQRLANRLGGRIEASPRGRNIFLLTNGTYTDNQPSSLSMVAKVYYGGHENEITDDEVTALTAAGYGEYIS
jgi:hypothetical protein